jgi:hypothetical protein
MRVVSKPASYSISNSHIEGAYYTDANKNGSIYMLAKWKPGEKPVETFDKEDWAGCLHGCALALTVLQDPTRTQAAIEDDGILHELIHIIHFPHARYELGNYPSIRGLRDEIYKLQEDAIGAYERIVEQSEQIHQQQAAERKEREEQYLRRQKHNPFEPQFLLPQFYGRGIRPSERAEKFFRIPEQSEAQIQQEASRKFKVEFAPGLKRVYPGEPVHQSVLQRSGEEETRPSSIDGEAGRSDDVR